MSGTLLDGLCVGQYQPAMIVVTRLDSDCTPLTGNEAQARTNCFSSVDAQNNVDEGQEFGRKNADGSRCWYVRDCDRNKQWDLTLSVLSWDWELIELMTASDLIIGKIGSSRAGKVVGIETPGPSASCPNGASLEVYVPNAPADGSGGICSSISGFPAYTRHLWPFGRFRIGQVTLDDNGDGIVLNMSGFALPNPNWGTGPANNWEGAGGVGSTTPYAMVYSDTLPAATCGYATAVA